MKVKDGFKMRRLGSEFIITGSGLGNINFNKMISLNASAAYLWESVQGKDFTAEDLKDLLLQRYEVSEEIAAADSEKLLADWVEAGIVSE